MKTGADRGNLVRIHIFFLLLTFFAVSPLFASEDGPSDVPTGKVQPVASAKLGAALLVTASKNGNMDKVRRLLANGADPDSADENHLTALNWAAYHGYQGIVEALVESGADVDSNWNSEKWTPLMNATGTGHNAIRDYLVDHGADTSLKSADGRTAEEIGFAFLEKSLEDDDLMPQNNQPELIDAIIHGGSGQKANALIAQGADVNVRNAHDQTPLMLAAYYGYADTVRLLIDKGADVNAINSSHTTALVDAIVTEGHVEVVKLLIDNGADVTQKDYNGTTPLHWAAHLGYTEIVKLLINKGADLNAKDSNGDTALSLAEYRRDSDTAELLRAAGAH